MTEATAVHLEWPFTLPMLHAAFLFFLFLIAWMSFLVVRPHIAWMSAEVAQRFSCFSVGEVVGAAVGSVDGTSVGVMVGAWVGGSVGVEDGLGDGALVVGGSVGVMVGACVGGSVGVSETGW